MVPKITLYFIQASRCIRTAWQLEELGLEYDVKSCQSGDDAAYAQFREESGGPGKFPTLDDDGKKYYESGNICEYALAQSICCGVCN